MDAGEKHPHEWAVVPRALSRGRRVKPICQNHLGNSRWFFISAQQDNHLACLKGMVRLLTDPQLAYLIYLASQDGSKHFGVYIAAAHDATDRAAAKEFRFGEQSGDA